MDIYTTTQTLSGNMSQNIRMANNTFRKIGEAYKGQLRDVYGGKTAEKVPHAQKKQHAAV